MSVFRRRLMMAGKYLKDYTFLEYLQFNGGQYIDTGVKPYNNMQISFRVALLSANGTMFGTGTQNLGIGLYSSLVTGSDNYYIIHAVHNSKKYEDRMFRYDNTPFDMNLDDDHLYLYGNIIHTFSSLPSSISNLPSIYLGDSNGDNPEYGRLIGRVYHLVLYYNHVAQVRLFPILDEYRVPCFLDLDTDRKFYNKGTGSFVAGPTREDPRI